MLTGSITSRERRISGGKESWKKDFQKNGVLYLLFLPLAIYFIIFNYIPMGGVLMAFENFKIGKGIFGRRGASAGASGGSSGGGLWKGIKNFFGIHSPSTKMAFIGDMMMEGLGEGLESSGRQVIKDAGLIKRDLMNEFEDLNTDIARVPTDYNINTNVPQIAPSTPTATNVGAMASNGPVNISLSIENFNNYSTDDIEALTEEILSTANAFVIRKGVAY